MSINRFNFLLAIFSGSLLFCLPAVAATNNSAVSVDVYFCNHDTVCDVSLGENSTFCSDDCPPPICNNNGICDNSENTDNCPSDCKKTTNPGSGGAGGGYVTNTSTPNTSSTVISTTTTTAPTETTTTIKTFLANPLFLATGQDSQVYLVWKKINLADKWSKVVIRRSTLFYPENINSGGLLYDGLGKTADGIKFFIYDANLQNGKRYFYSIFIFGENGEESSGVSVSALTVARTVAPSSSTLEIPKIEIPPETTLPKSPNFKEINFNDLTFNTSSPSTTLVEIPAEKVPSSTFTAIMTLQDETGYQSYIMGVWQNGMYTNFPSVFGVEKQLTITFLDKNHQIISEINGKIGTPLARVAPTTNFFQKIIPILTDWRVILGAIFTVILLILRFL